ncbi:ABC transporter permease [Conexibacter woesei]|uniref:Binding-protein-dependent transport systems inner membrane component n=1 Tax=Conexibacter woesei (strain DSM 14684 / CCUG 47730 / CIP 108061 / JCM 11494 / NBRC 100937 / ID131577) TaxID=469383 RepID=D3FD61_CONWI|nr:ABC transporter permease [Conexibacter woesei]ADB53453.1 binding-protein-dependent transport systems inner membrane component [Conexibacter woesei DSM 14684]
MSTPAITVETDTASRRRRGSRFGTLGPLGWAALVVVVAAALLALFGPLLAPHDPNRIDLNLAYVGPYAGHPLGMDGQGRDLLSRLMVGARASMLGPLLVVAISTVLGGVLALLAAWRGGVVDQLIARLLDTLLAVPGLLLAILAVAVFGPGLTAPVIALGISYTPFFARILRGSALREVRQQYVEALRVQGFGGIPIVLKHLVPNLLPLLTAQATVNFGYALIDLAALSYLGLGVQPPTADWGAMVFSGQAGIVQGYYMESLAAGACIVAVVCAFNVLGERLADRWGAETR